MRCGFGCAICGATITEYEHFYPDFADAVAHDPKRIVLLCPNHHALATKRVLPKEQVAIASMAPVAMREGFSKLSHPWFTGVPSLKIGGGGIVHSTPVPIRVRGESLLQFSPPETGSHFARISATLRDASGSECLKITNNEWKVIGGKWDFQFIANRYIFNDLKRAPMLVMRMEPPNFIAIELMRTSVCGVPVHITEDKMRIGGMEVGGCVVSNCSVGFSVG